MQCTRDPIQELPQEETTPNDEIINQDDPYRKKITGCGKIPKNSKRPSHRRKV